ATRSRSPAAPTASSSRRSLARRASHTRPSPARATSSRRTRERSWPAWWSTSSRARRGASDGLGVRPGNHGERGERAGPRIVRRSRHDYPDGLLEEEEGRDRGAQRERHGENREADLARRVAGVLLVRAGARVARELRALRRVPLLRVEEVGHRALLVEVVEPVGREI